VLVESQLLFPYQFPTERTGVEKALHLRPRGNSSHGGKPVAATTTGFNSVPAASKHPDMLPDRTAGHAELPGKRRTGKKAGRGGETAENLLRYFVHERDRRRVA